MSRLVLGIGVNDIGSTGYRKEYDSWRGILRRCYDPNHKSINPAYDGVTCNTHWFNFSYFLNDIKNMTGYDKYLIDDWCVDKDILFKGNREYSNDKCCLIPRAINSLFTNRRNFRGQYPVGVTWIERDNKFISQLSIGGKQKILGYFNSPIDAFEVYKYHKECEIKRIAEIFKSDLDEKVYLAMINWVVEIDD